MAVQIGWAVELRVLAEAIVMIAAAMKMIVKIELHLVQIALSAACSAEFAVKSVG